MTSVASPSTRLALVGAGRIAESHVHAAAALPDVRISVIVDPDLESAELLAARVGGDVTVATSLDAIPDSVDGAVICSPTRVHAEQALALIARGIAVLVEKPLAANRDEAVAIIEAAERSGLVAHAAQVLRYLPMVDVAREVIASGRFGRPVQVIERRLTDRADNYPWWKDLPAFLVSHWGSHSVDLVCHLFGDRVERVVCEADSVRSQFDVVDDFSLLARFESGLRMTSTMSFSSRFPTHDIVLIGTGATIVLDCYGAVSVDGQEVFRLPEQEMLEQGFAAQLEDFVSTIRGEGRGISPVASALPAIDALTEAERSALASRARRS